MPTNDPIETRYRQDRRGFLKQLLVAGGTLGSGLAIGADAQTRPEASVPDDQPRDRGYRETEHVRQYYAKAAL